MYSEWDADADNGRKKTVKLLTFIHSKTLKSVLELFLKESKASQLGAVFKHSKNCLS